MIALVTEKQTELDALCRQYHVKTLDLFGSATGDAFDPDRVIWTFSSLSRNWSCSSIRASISACSLPSRTCLAARST